MSASTSTSAEAQETTPEFDAFWAMLSTSTQPASSGLRLIASGTSFEINLPVPPFGPQRNEHP